MDPMSSLGSPSHLNGCTEASYEFGLWKKKAGRGDHSPNTGITSAAEGGRAGVQAEVELPPPPWLNPNLVPDRTGASAPSLGKGGDVARAAAAKNDGHDRTLPARTPLLEVIPTAASASASAPPQCYCGQQVGKGKPSARGGRRPSLSPANTAVLKLPASGRNTQGSNVEKPTPSGCGVGRERGRKQVEDSLTTVEGSGGLLPAGASSTPSSLGAVPSSSELERSSSKGRRSFSTSTRRNGDGKTSFFQSAPGPPPVAFSPSPSPPQSPFPSPRKSPRLSPRVRVARAGTRPCTEAASASASASLSTEEILGGDLCIPIRKRRGDPNSSSSSSSCPGVLRGLRASPPLNAASSSRFPLAIVPQSGAEGEQANGGRAVCSMSCRSSSGCSSSTSVGSGGGRNGCSDSNDPHASPRHQGQQHQVAAAATGALPVAVAVTRLRSPSLEELGDSSTTAGPRHVSVAHLVCSTACKRHPG